MKTAIGLLEFKSIAKGIAVMDDVLKSSHVTLVTATPICPGKYIGLITGEIAAVQNAVKVGERLGGIFLVEAIALSNLHRDVIPALSGSTGVALNGAIGVVETMSALGAIEVADTACKAAAVSLLEVRIARGLGGKGFLVFTGELASVKAAIAAGESAYNGTGEILCATAVASPEKALLSALC